MGSTLTDVIKQLNKNTSAIKELKAQVTDLQSKIPPDKVDEVKAE
jgi:hypothetical protein